MIDVRAVFPARSSRALRRGHAGLSPAAEGPLRTCDYEKIFCADLNTGNDIFTARGIDRERGCVVVVRPDQYIAHVLPLDGYQDLAASSMAS